MRMWSKVKSMGKNQGVKCPTCKVKSSTQWQIEKRVPPISGWVQPPFDKRRHLAKPLV